MHTSPLRSFLTNTPQSMLRLIEGADGGGGGGSDAPPEGADGDSGDDGSSDTPPEGSSSGDKVKIEELPEDVQALVRRYRKEAAEASGKARDKAKADAAAAARDEVMADIGKKLGFVKDDAKLTPEQFEAKLTEEGKATAEARTEARQTKIELAVYRTGSKLGADSDALLDSRTFLAKVQALDPSSDKFADEMTKAIKDAVKDNPKLKASQAGAGSSSTDHAGGSGDGKPREPKSLDDAVSSHYST